MYYVLRDENGVMKAKISPKAASAIFTSANGSWKPFITKESTKRAFYIDENCTWGSEHAKIYFWVGDKIIEEN